MSGRMIGVVILIFGFWPAVGTAGPITVWSRGFENGFPLEATASGNWRVVTSDQAAHSGSRGADIIGATAAGGDTLVFDLSSEGFTDVGIEFWTKVRDGLEADDFVRAEWSSDAGLNWEPLVTLTNVAAGDWVFNQFPLPVEANDNPNFGLRVDAVLSTGGDRMAFDDFALSGTPVPEPASLAMLALGSLAGFHRKFRRRFS